MKDWMINILTCALSAFRKGLDDQKLIESRLIVLVWIDAANLNIPCVLLHGRSRPPSDLSEIWKWGGVIVFSVPQECRWDLGACEPVSENFIPKVPGCVNSNPSVVVFYPVYCFVQEVTVGGKVVGVPGASWAWVGFHIHPNNIVKGVGYFLNQLIYLCSWVFAPAREHVHIGFQSNASSIIQIRHRI